MIEIESKFALDGADDFARLLAVLPAPLRTRDQLNMYLDTMDRRIKTSNGSLRLRIAQNRAWLTLKRRIPSNLPGVFEAVEFEEETPRDEAVAWVEKRGILRPPEGPGFSGILELFKGDQLGVVAWSRTLRRAFDIGEGGIVLEADQTVFGDGSVDYELEIESADSELALGVVTGLARRAGIKLKAQSRTKHARAIAHAGDRPMLIPGKMLSPDIDKATWPR